MVDSLPQKHIFWGKYLLIIKLNLSETSMLAKALFSFVVCIIFLPSLALTNTGYDPKDPHSPAPKKTLAYPYFKKYAHPLLSPFSYHIGVGITAYAGDLSTPPDFANQKNHLTPLLNLGISYRLTHFISLRAELSGFQLYSQPKENSNLFTGFKSLNAEGSLVLVHEFIPKSSIESYSSTFSPYLFGGVGYTLFNPRSIEDDRDLLAVNDTTVSNMALVIPAGVGIKYYLHESINIELEGGVRFARTDVLDGNVGLDNNRRDDMYFFFGARVNVQFMTKYRYRRHLKR